MDALDKKLLSFFPSKVVRKDLLWPMKGQLNVPTYVLEYLLGKYCSSSDENVVREGLNEVRRILTRNYARPDQSELVKSMIKEKGSYRIIDKVKVRLVETEDKYWAELTNLQLNFVNIPDDIVIQNEKLMVGGIWSIVELCYDSNIIHRGVTRPFIITDLQPIQLAVSSLDEVKERRRYFTRDEWLDIILRSIGIEPGNRDFDFRKKLLFLSRLLPLAENNFNLVELGQRGTGKSYMYREISPFAILISGGKTTTASLFMHLGTGRVGLVGVWDVVGFDEVAGLAFKDAMAVPILKDYMELGSFSRGMEEIHANASLVFNGNINNIDKVLETSHLFSPFPPEMQDIALLDRIHFFHPGWELPKMKDEYLTGHYGFVVNYIAELLRELRKLSYINEVDKYYNLGPHLNTRDLRAVRKTISGFIKILHPDGNVSKKEIEEYLVFSLEMRRRVKEQLRKMSGKEYWAVDFSYIDKENEQEKYVDVPEIARLRSKKIELGEPRIGRVYGLGYTGFGGSLMVLEVASMRGKGRLKMTGGLKKTIKESIQTAYDYLRANYEKYGIEKNYFESYDIHFQAVELAMPKEGPSAGITSAAVLLSAATGKKVRSDIAMTGELTIHGEVYPVGGIEEKVTAAYENGLKVVIIPEKNQKDINELRDELREKIQFIFVSNIDEVFNAAFI